MSRTNWIVAAALAAALAAPAAAGEGSKCAEKTTASAATVEHKCTKDTQACLNDMVSSMKDRGWAGLEMDKGEGDSWVVSKIYPGSPAESAGVRKGDALVALNGIRVGDESKKEALYAAKKMMKPGSRATYTFNRDGHEKEIAITLAAPPQDVIAGWIGSHMIEHAQTEIAKN
jgi:predicted metalloprotease with PDZ domain